MNTGRVMPPWMILALGMGVAIVPSTAGSVEELRGVMIVAGHGPERPMIEKLGRAFEKAYQGTVVDIKWNRNFRTAEMVKSGKADLAVSGMEDPDLTAATVAWDGIAVIVNFSNPVKEVTTQQLRDLFSGTIRAWFDLNENVTGKIELIRRPDDRNITVGFERALGLSGKITDRAESIRSDQKVLSRVSGRLGAVGYLSIGSALEAVKFGTPVRILRVNGVDPGEPTVKNGRYALRRPVLFLTRKESSPLVEAFTTFVLSPEGQRIVDEAYLPVSP